MIVRRRRRAGIAAAAAAALGVSVLAGIAATSAAAAPADRSGDTASPIKHLVVIYDENVSFDHYFGTYPHATNTDGTKFVPISSTPRANTLITSHKLYDNPNSYDPFRLSPSQALTCDQDHGYTAEQQAFDNGAMDKFVQYTSNNSCSGAYGRPGLVMGYYDGNTVTALWNYAQQYAMSDNFFGSTFGPSSPGALELAAGQTHGVEAVTPVTHRKTTDSYVVRVPDANGIGTMINDPDPAFDDCSDNNHTNNYNLAEMHGRNIGNLLNNRGVTWGWFEGGFIPTTRYAGHGTFAVCGASHQNIGGATVTDYIPHHDPFQYYASTANEHHRSPAGLAEIGHNGRANHQYDLTWFNRAVRNNDLPAVSFVKAPAYQDGHAGYSDPIDEQHFLVKEINMLESSAQWRNTAVVISYDDSDGWYDHVHSAIRNSSHTSDDAAICRQSNAPVRLGYQDRCGPGPRLPLLVISPWAKTNAIAHNFTQQADITKFVEDNWFLPRLGDGSFDAEGGTLNRMFDFTASNNKRVLLNPNGSIKSITPISRPMGAA